MKVAICLSGSMKYPDKALQSIKCIFPNEFVKVFIHTWYIEDENEFKKTCYSNINPNETYYTDNNVNLDILNQIGYEKLLIENYNYKKEHFEKLFNELRFISYNRKDIGPLSMWYSIYKSNELKKEYEKENNFIFDKVVRMRFDSDFQGKILDLSLFDDTVHIPSGRDWAKINDQFALGGSEKIDLYCNMYNDIRSLLNVDYCSEDLLLQHLRNKKLTVKKFNFNIEINNGFGPQFSWLEKETMLLEFKELYRKYVMNITGVIHVGAHYGEEVETYVNSGITDIILFEPLSENFDILEKNVSKLNANIQGHQVALGNENKMVTMYLSSNDLESSSILKPNLESKVFSSITFDRTEEVEMKRLDDYNLTGYNFINMDVQGYELEVLKGAEKTLEQIDYVYCEVNKGIVYENNALIEEIDQYLSKYNLNRVETSWWGDDDWGDALYIKNY